MVDSCAGQGLGGRTAKTHADQFNAGAPQNSGGQGDIRAGHVPDLHETGDMERRVAPVPLTPARRADPTDSQAPHQRAAPDVLRRRAAYKSSVPKLITASAPTFRSHSRRAGLRPAATTRSAPKAALASCTAKGPGDPGCAEREPMLARPYSGAVLERQPHRQGGVRHCRGKYRVDALGALRWPRRDG